MKEQCAVPSVEGYPDESMKSTWFSVYGTGYTLSLQSLQSRKQIRHNMQCRVGTAWNKTIIQRHTWKKFVEMIK